MQAPSPRFDAYLAGQLPLPPEESNIPRQLSTELARLPLARQRLQRLLETAQRSLDAAQELFLQQQLSTMQAELEADAVEVVAEHVEHGAMQQHADNHDGKFAVGDALFLAAAVLACWQQEWQLQVSPGPARLTACLMCLCTCRAGFAHGCACGCVQDVVLSDASLDTRAEQLSAYTFFFELRPFMSDAAVAQLNTFADA